MDRATHAAATWLLDSDEPAIRLMTRRDVLGEQTRESPGEVRAGAKVTALLSGQPATADSDPQRRARLARRRAPGKVR